VVDSLTAIGSPICAEDHIDAILDGLLEEYDSFVTSVTSWLDPYTTQDIESLLMAQEDRFDKHIFLDSSPAQVHFSSTGLVPSSSFKASLQGGRSSSRAPFHQKRQHYSCPPHPNYWRFVAPSLYFQPRVQCQLCFKFGDTTLTCLTRTEDISSSPIIANMSSFQQPLHYPKPSILGTPSIVSDPLWYLDTGATHHITNDPIVFNKKQIYNGSENVQLGNGSGMSIHSVGSTSLRNSSSNHLFTLHNLLHVPTINKNLLSVSQFARDNGVFFEFFS